MTNYNTDGLLGVDVTRADDDPAFNLGQLARGNDGSEWVYCQANGAIASAGQVSIIDEGWQAALASTSNTDTAFGQRCGVAPAALADNQYGWQQIGGVCGAIQVSASCAANKAINSTATAGELDDDATGGAEVINGIVLTTARTSSAGTAPGVIFNPAVGATL